MNTEKNKKLSEAMGDVDSLMEAIKAGSKDTIKSLLSEAIKDAINDEISGEEDDYEVSDENPTNGVETETEPVDGESEPIDDTAKDDMADYSEEGDEDAEGADDADDSEGDEWSQFDGYKVGDDTYDLTGEKDSETVAKVYKLLKDTDQVVIQKTGDRVELKDNETGAEYVIELGGDDEPAETEDEPDASVDDLNEEEVFELVDDEPMDNEPLMNEGKKSKKVMKENKQVLFEIDLGYTDNYQDKDPIEGLSMSEPSKSGKQIDKGIPSGTEKPWAGKSEDKGEPYGNSVNEDVTDVAGLEGEEETPIEENNGVTLGGTQATIEHKPENGRKRNARNLETSKGREKNVSDAPYNESAKKQLEKLMKENKALKKAVVSMKQSIQEAYVVNVSLGQFARLMLENSVSQKEKVDILNRLNESKSAEQSKALYESISRELKGAPAATMVNESVMTAAPTKALQEAKEYQNKSALDMIDFMKRMGM